MDKNQQLKVKCINNCLVISSEQNARILINSDGHGNTEVVGPITNNSGHMEYQAKSGIFNVTFRNMVCIVA